MSTPPPTTPPSPPPLGGVPPGPMPAPSAVAAAAGVDAVPPPPPSGSTLPKKPANPALKYLGIPNIRAKIPSKPWLIFIGVSLTWTGLIYHDRREKRLALEKWCKKVAHLADQPLPSNQLARKIKVYIAAPPGDGISAGRDYFKEYVKPVLVAAALDYEVVEGRRGGEVRTSVGETIRRWRRRHGEKGVVQKDALKVLEGGGEAEVGDDLAEIRRTMGITHEVEEDEGGVMVIGRHTWKEFLHGVHEGWLGPAGAQVPPPPPPAPPAVGQPYSTPKPTRLPIAQPVILPEQYADANLPPSFPHESSSLPASSPVVVIPFPHLLGFLNTPIRIYRYLTQRHLADQVGREAAAICLGYTRAFDAQTREIDAGCYPEEEGDWGKKYRSIPEPEPVEETPAAVAPTTPSPSTTTTATSTVTTLGEEVAGVEKSAETAPEKKKEEEEVKKPEPSESERFKMALRRDAGEWAGEIVVDGRILGRLRRYELPAESAGEFSPEAAQ